MKIEIKPNRALPVVVPRRIVKLNNDRLEERKVLWPVPLDQKAYGHRLKSFSNRKNFNGVSGSERGHVSATTRRRYDETFVLEHAQRFTNRPTARPHLGRQITLDNPLAVAHLT